MSLTIEQQHLEGTYDDLGAYGGDFYFPKGREARELVRRAGFAAFGTRPNDFLKRELLVGGAFRDDRNIKFRRLARDVHPLLEENNPQVPAMQRGLYYWCRAFDFLYREKLLRILDGPRPDSDGRFYDSLVRCPTSLYQLPPRGRGEPVLQKCGRSIVCPYCMSRQAEKAYALLLSRLQSRDYAYFGRISLNFEVGVPSWTEPDPDPYFRAEVDSARKFVKRIGGNLCGMSGGITVVTLGPALAVSHERDEDLAPRSDIERVEVRVSAVGPADFGDVERSDVGDEFSLPAFEDERFTLSGHAYTPCIRGGSATAGDLRRLLVGLWPDATNTVLDEETRCGAFRAFPWSLASLNQFEFARLQARRIQVFSPFGDLAPSHPERVKNRALRIRQRNLVSANRRNRARREHRTQELASALRSIYDGFLRAGRRVGRVTFQAAAERAGIFISDRDSRLVLAYLQRTYPR